MKKRREARIKALEVLYQHEISQEPIDDVIDVLKQIEVKFPEFAEDLIYGVMKNLTAIDKQVAYASNRWTLDRMPTIDRNILRIATFEMIFENEIPISVSINEAVEIAKEYGTPDSSKFVNGVLGAIATDIEKK